MLSLEIIEPSKETETMQDDRPLTPQQQSLLDVCNVVVRKMREEGAYGEAHRVREFVDSLFDHTRSRYPHVMVEDATDKAMRDEVVATIALHFAMREAN